MTYSRLFDEATFEVGSQCQFSMASVNEDDGSFCFDPEKIEYSEPTTCVIQGKELTRQLRGPCHCKSDVVSIVSHFCLKM